MKIPQQIPRIQAGLVAGVCGLLLVGCASKALEVKVDSISRQSAATEAQSYKQKNKNPTVDEDNLRYREAAEFIRTALSGKGLYEAPTEDRADMIVELDYGLEKPRTKVERITVPVYAQVGGGVRYDSVPVIDPRGNRSLRTVAVYDPPRSELVGYEEVPRQITVYEKYLRITARENKPVSEGRPPTELWSVQASAEDESKDLRKYLPVMASATIESIGRESDSHKVVKVRTDGPGVEFVRRGMSSAKTESTESPPPAAPKI